MSKGPKSDLHPTSWQYCLINYIPWKQSQGVMGAGGGLGTMMDQRVDCSIKDPSKLQKLCNKKIPDFLSEYVKKVWKGWQW